MSQTFKLLLFYQLFFVATIDDDSIPYIPYKTLISLIRNTFFDESEVQELIEILTKKAGGGQDPWFVV